MTLDELIAQCAARGLDWQITCGHGLNGLPSYTALVIQPSADRPPGAVGSVYGMGTRIDPAEALGDALARLSWQILGGNHGK